MSLTMDKYPSKESSTSISTCDVGHDACTSFESTSDTMSCCDPMHSAACGGQVALRIDRHSFSTRGAYKPMLMKRREIESVRRDGQQKHLLLGEALQDAACKLGSAHPLVESTRETIKAFRSREEIHRSRQIVLWHTRNISAAMWIAENCGSLGQLEDAIAVATQSELGAGHKVVLEAKATLLSLKKKHALMANKAVVDLQATRLHAALGSGDLNMFATTIAEASDAIGSSHRVVKVSRELFKSLRAQKQRDDWAALVQLHEAKLAKVCETSMVDSIQAEIMATATALGWGHPLVQAGKAFLLETRKCLQHEREQRTIHECYQSLLGVATFAESALTRLEAECTTIQE